jgi:hypothetical protein
VTFLFTDVEGSTRRWEADAEGMRAALAVHDAVLRSAIERHGGWLFKHTGDGVCAAFVSPRSAVDAAVAAQRELQLPVRMGMATGEAELRDSDYFGTVLNRAARVMATGHGGQILLADSTAVLLSGVDLMDLGSRRLRDVPTPVGVFQVRAPGLATDFPPLRALDTSPGNLRRATSSLIGRESELDEVQAAVKAHRLVTLTGVGGVGKTRLALELAAQSHACRLQNSVSFPNPLKCGFAELHCRCRNGFLHSGWPIPLPYRHFRSRITPGAPSLTLQEFDADSVDIVNVRGELAVVSQDIGNRESQRCSAPTE